MRIIDKNSDFYDHLQYTYPDDSVTFDRTDSFVIAKEDMCHRLDLTGAAHLNKIFALLQVCNTFWLLWFEATERDDLPRSTWSTTDFRVSLLAKWKNYNKPRALISFDEISFPWKISRRLIDIHDEGRGVFTWNQDKVVALVPTLRQAIDAGDFEVDRNLATNLGLRGYRHGDSLKHIPILKECGISHCIDPVDIYRAFEEYFMLEKSSSERAESLNITDKEKIVNHGFDVKQSFRGKRK